MSEEQFRDPSVEWVCKGHRVFVVLQLLRLDLLRKSRLLLFLNSVLCL